MLLWFLVRPGWYNWTFSGAKQRANKSRDYLAALTSNQTPWIGLPHGPAPKLFRRHPRSNTDLQATYRTLLIAKIHNRRGKSIFLSARVV